MLLWVLLMSRNIYQNLIIVKIAKLDIYLLLRSAFIFTYSEQGKKLGWLGQKEQALSIYTYLIIKQMWGCIFVF